MKLLQHLVEDKKNGFTLIEIAIVTAIIAVIFMLGAPVAWEFYQQYQLDSESELVESLLRQARDQTMINRNESVHGLYLSSSNFVIFQGPTYATRNQTEDQIFPRSGGVSVAGPAEIVFTVFSGQTASSTYILSNQFRQRSVGVNSEGMVYEIEN